MKTIEEIKVWLKDNLDEERYLHTLGVAQCASELAQRYGLNVEKTYLAGLLHDCAKCYDDATLYKILTANGKEFISTDNHIYVTDNGEKTAQELFDDMYVNDIKIISSLQNNLSKLI